MNLIAGAALELLDFPPGVPLAGFAARTDPSSGVHDSLTARALAVSSPTADTIIVVADLTSMSPGQATEVRARIAEATGVGLDGIVVTVTHTHSAPNLDPWMTTPTADPALWVGVMDALVRAAVTAHEGRVSATIGHAAAPTALAVNRRRPDGPLDTTLDVVRFDAIDGPPIAVAFAYACHPTIVGPDNTLLSADWPGAARAVVEEALPGAVALFLQGCCGDCNVGHSAHDSMDGTGGGVRTPEEAGRRGAAIGREVLQLAGRAEAMPGIVAVESREWSWRWIADEAITPTVGPKGPTPAEALIQQLVPVWRHRLERGALPVDETLTATWFRWGDALLVLASGEPFAALGLELRDSVAGMRVIPLGYANGTPGYLPYPRAERELGGYEVGEAHVVYGRPTPMPDAFAHHVLEHARGAAAFAKRG